MRTSTSEPRPGPAALRRLIDREAKLAGFDAVAVTRPDLDSDPGAGLRAYVGKGYHGSMDWMAETLERRASATAIWPEVRSVIVLAMNYAQDVDPTAILQKPDCGAISVYARNRDY
ncbi:DUF1730 domain-containing protein, partial [Escherichia coli]|nr:DUF1730 domain-containing protein [Escherichia coli]